MYLKTGLTRPGPLFEEFVKNFGRSLCGRQKIIIPCSGKLQQSHGKGLVKFGSRKRLTLPKSNGDFNPQKAPFQRFLRDLPVVLKFQMSASLMFRSYRAISRILQQHQKRVKTVPVLGFRLSGSGTLKTRSRHKSQIRHSQKWTLSVWQKMPCGHRHSYI